MAGLKRAKISPMEGCLRCSYFNWVTLLLCEHILCVPASFTLPLTVFDIKRLSGIIVSYGKHTKHFTTFIGYYWRIYSRYPRSRFLLQE